MNRNRRRFFALAAAAIAAPPCFGGPARGQEEALALTRLVVPSTPGSVSYRLAHALQKAWPIHARHPLAVVERAGGAGTLAVQELVRGATDGSVLLLANTGTHVVRPEAVEAGQIKTLRPVAKLASAPGVLVCSPVLKTSALPEMVQVAKSRPGELSFASAGIGSLGHLVMEAISKQAGIALLHVPYKSSAESLSDLLASRIHLNILSVNAALAHVRAGRLKALAFSGQTRSTQMPEVPTFRELGFEGADIESWQGLFVHNAVSQAVHRRLMALSATVMQDASFRSALRLESLDVSSPTGVEEFSRLIAAQHVQVRELMRAHSIRLI